MKPIVPGGATGYAAIEVPPEHTTTERYALEPGDIISVVVYGEKDLSVEEIAVDNAGIVSLPLIGDVRASGQSASELARDVELAYSKRYIRDPHVSVLIKKASALTIAVEGEVEQPGIYPYAKGQTLLSALALARSPTDTAKLDEVIIFRTIDGKRMAGRFDVQQIRGGRMPNVDLVPGDLVVAGYSSLRGAYLDALRTIPFIGVFGYF